MVTLVGTQSDLVSAIKSLIELDFDAVEAYEAAVNRLEDPLYKTKLTEFCHDHRRHIRELTQILSLHGEKAPDGPSAKQWLTKGKVVLANLLGDKNILAAMLSNEEDTNAAYENMNNREDIWPDLMEILRTGLADERRHKQWIEGVTQK